MRLAATVGLKSARRVRVRPRYAVAGSNARLDPLSLRKYLVWWDQNAVRRGGSVDADDRPLSTATKAPAARIAG